jgi:hypothetical protein
MPFSLTHSTYIIQTYKLFLLQQMGLAMRKRSRSRVRRSYSLKAKISENVGIFVLALKRKKAVFFALFICKRKTPNSEKNLSERSQKRKEKRKITIPVKVRRSLYKYFLTTFPKSFPNTSLFPKGIIIPLPPLPTAGGCLFYR